MKVFAVERQSGSWYDLFLPRDLAAVEKTTRGIFKR